MTFNQSLLPLASHFRSRCAVLFLAALLLPLLASAQSLVPPEEAAAAADRINHHAEKNSLKFYSLTFDKRSILDFNFRYKAHFSFQFLLGDLPEGGKVRALVRVTPKTGAPVFLSEAFDIPSVQDAVSGTAYKKLLEDIPSDDEVQTDEMRKDLMHRLNSGGPMVADFGGNFAVGPGEYQIELLLTSNDGRSFFKKWKLKTERSADWASLTSANTVEAEVPSRWTGKVDRNGPRLTILLNATAIDISRAKLWDAHFLLKMVSSILEILPCRSVRLVAFNLDKQAEFFRRDSFDSTGWKGLEKALREPEFVSIDYHSLTSGAEPEFLTNLVVKELHSDSDAVVLIGRTTHFLNKIPKDLKPLLQTGRTKIFYLQHDGWVSDYAFFGSYGSPVSYGFPDTVAHLVHDLHGTVLHFANPHQFATALEQVRKELANTTTPALAGRVN